MRPIPAAALGAQIGVLLDCRETALAEAIRAALDLDQCVVPSLRSV